MQETTFYIKFQIVASLLSQSRSIEQKIHIASVDWETKR